MVEEKPRSSYYHENIAKVKELILYNDDFHSFDDVIMALVEVCNHQPEQAEQCAYIAHFKGSCAVKCGPLTELKPMAAELLTRNLTVEIE